MTNAHSIVQIGSRDLLGTPETSLRGRRTLTARSVRRSIWLPDCPDWLGANSVMNLQHHRHRIDKYLDTLLANQPISDGEATDRCKSLRRKMADCPS